MNAILFNHTQLPQASAKLQSQLLKLHEALVRVPAQLEKGPLLIHLRLLAINDLLHLLDLVVRLDQLARSNGFCIAVVLRAVLEDVVHGVDFWMRLGDQLVLAFCIATRYRLSLDALVARCFDGDDTRLVYFWERVERFEVCWNRHRGEYER
jgi:hypothetical protein